MKIIPEYNWRITKYNPVYRDERGAYLKDDWISISDIGESFEGAILTLEDYMRAEDAYVSSAFNFFGESGLKTLEITYLEKRNFKWQRDLIKDISLKPKQIKTGMILCDEDLRDVCRLALREIIWCRLEVEAKFYVHFGYDYYMYIGSRKESNDSINYAAKNGLFVEKMLSPHLFVEDEF